MKTKAASEPEEFEFAMSFLGNPEEKIVREYVATLRNQIEGAGGSTGPLPDFKTEWAKKVAAGYNYGEDALQGVRFGFEIAMAAMATERAAREIRAFLDENDPEVDWHDAKNVDALAERVVEAVTGRAP